VLRLNPLSFLRAQVDHDCPVGLDGNGNVVGPPEEDRAHLLGLQLETVAGILDAFVAACALAVGRGLAPRFRVRSAELNRDLVRGAAPELARRIAGTPSHWFGRSDAAYYPARHGREVDGNLAVATWRNGRRDAPVHYKFYAKTEGLLRVEVALANRRAVVLFGGGAEQQGPAAGGGELARCLGALAVNACPLLTDMAAHVGRFQAPSGGVLDLLAALAPLLSMSAPPPPRKPGGRAGAVTREYARRAVAALLQLGRFDASEVPSNNQLRKKLREMAGYGGLLADARGRAPVYALPPHLAEARGPLAGALVPHEPRNLARGAAEQAG
jgi:hypothetical protein